MKRETSKESKVEQKTKLEALKGYDDLLVAKRSSSLIMKLTIGICVFVVIAMMFLVVSIHISTVDKVKVVDLNGNILPSKLAVRENLTTSFVENQCALAVGYLNSFDRLSIKDNQARVLFLMNSDDANRVFSQYTTQNSYADVLSRGVIYRTEYDKLLNIDISKQPYRVKFQSVLTISDNDQPQEHFLVISEGELVNHTAQYPENPVGLYFKKYSQRFQKLENKEEVGKQEKKEGE